ncbi:YpdA family putative bacillithiol disulfide reductase [Paenibacillus wenxiniae]|uniref:YpdA family putative bacillithiol disulfide reductase n=1 Tax=Paenibacillus wenxiniae TaxID=1636843 RepID=A0ABW4RPS3_9BACL
MQDVIIVGAGPCGLSAAIECERLGLNTLLIEKYNVVHSIYLYPTNMQFFSTAELLEIGDLPFPTPNEKPFRHEALAYYRRAAQHYDLNVQPYTEATGIEKQADGSFRLHTVNRHGQQNTYEARRVIIATGYFDHPNYLGIPGEDLDKVTHYFREAHPYTGMRVAIIGGSNSAVDAALEIVRVGAKVDMVYRGHDLSANIKSWVRPIFEGLVMKGKINLHLNSCVTNITESEVHVTRTGDGSVDKLDNDFVLAMTGFRPDRKLITSMGVTMSDDMDKPRFDPDTMETNIEGLYVAGVIASGRNANEVFIETGRRHGALIAQHIVDSLTPKTLAE